MLFEVIYVVFASHNILEILVWLNLVGSPNMGTIPVIFKSSYLRVVVVS